ncbi:hypothetical protein M4D57_01975 [Brevibacillus borstelensis]|uniref:hypothetical protein n=1 Tax=Brevibacillus borstelensis TaxID=45462 RepID=UPI00203ACC6E|nr:hypothetical protein [Brevibacillus borstelensis]MCM3557324.1 hypothetical protein [Brevibacillus borstelensis]
MAKVNRRKVSKPLGKRSDRLELPLLHNDIDVDWLEDLESDRQLASGGQESFTVSSVKKEPVSVNPPLQKIPKQQVNSNQTTFSKVLMNVGMRRTIRWSIRMI